MKRSIRKVIIALICVAMLFSACSSESGSETTTAAEEQITEAADKDVTAEEIVDEETDEIIDEETEEVTEEMTEEEPEETESTEPPTEVDPVTLSIGGKIENENFKMTFDSFEIVSEYSLDIASTGENRKVRIEEGLQLAVLRGHFTNTFESAIDEFAFIIRIFINDTVSEDAANVRFYFLGDPLYRIEPETDVDYVVLALIPDDLAKQYQKADITIGFNNDMSRPESQWVDDFKYIESENLYTVSITK